MGSSRSRKNRRSREKAQAPSAEVTPTSPTASQKPASSKVHSDVWITLLLIAAAWLFAFKLRQHWVDLARINPAFVTAKDNLLPTTNDSYYFAATLENWDTGNLENIVLMPNIYQHGMITMLPALLMKLFGFSANQIMIHLPIYVSGLLAVPLVLIGRLYGSLTWGFAAAMLAVAAHSYFNRTIAGYFDTDMFSVLVPVMALYFMLASHRRESLGAALGAALCLFLYPLFYQSGIPVAFALGVAFIGWQFLADGARESNKMLSSFSIQPLLERWRNNPFTWRSSLLVLVAMLFLEASTGHAIAAQPVLWFSKLGFIIGLFFLFRLKPIKLSVIAPMTGTAAVLFLFMVAPVGKIINKTRQYLPQPKVETAVPKQPVQGPLQFKNVIETVQEAQKEKSPWRNRGIISRRIIGSMTVCLLAAVGYVALVIRRPEFLMALPLVGIGVYALWGGFRFTIYATPIAALAVTHVFFLAFKKPWDHLIRVGLGLAVLGGLTWGGWALEQAGFGQMGLGGLPWNGWALEQNGSLGPPKLEFNATKQVYFLVQKEGHKIQSGLPLLNLLPLTFGVGLTMGMIAWLAPVRKSWLSVIVLGGVLLLGMWVARLAMYDTIHRWLVEHYSLKEALPNWTWEWTWGRTAWLSVGFLMIGGAVGHFWFRAGNHDAPRKLLRSSNLWRTAMAIVLGLGATVLLLRPNYRHALEYNKAMSQRPPVLEKGSVFALEKLREVSQPGDYVLTWWDWGTAVWHHAGRNVICHPGHQSDDVFVVAKMLSSTSPFQAANLARRTVEDFAKNPPPTMSQNVIRGILTEGNFGGPDAVLKSMASPEYLPPAPPSGERDIYLFLPQNLLQILPVIRTFSERDLSNGAPRPTGLYLPLPQVSIGRDFNGTTPITVKHNQQPTYEINANRGQMIYIKSLPPEMLFNNLTTKPRPLPSLSEADRFYRFEMSIRQNRPALAEWWAYQTCALFKQGQTNPLLGRLGAIGRDTVNFQPLQGPAETLPRAKIQGVHPVFLLNTTDVILTLQKGNQYFRDFKHFRPPNAGHQGSNLHITLTTEFGTCLAIDTRVYLSNLFQMLVLGVYDKRIFEPVKIPTMRNLGRLNVNRIYKLKR